MNISRTVMAFAFVIGALVCNNMHAALGRTAASKPSYVKIVIGAGLFGTGSTIAFLHEPRVINKLEEKKVAKWKTFRPWCPAVFMKEYFTTKTQEQAPATTPAEQKVTVDSAPQTPEKSQLLGK